MLKYKIDKKKKEVKNDSTDKKKLEDGIKK
jgi:hypothetical protein